MVSFRRMVLWCLILLWAFTNRLRRGLQRQINELSQIWNRAETADGVFSQLESDCEKIELFQQQLELLKQNVAGLEKQLAAQVDALGYRKEKPQG